MIEVKNLFKKFNDCVVIDKLSFSLLDNEGVFVIGNSGCGKTTLLRLLAGFDNDYDGKIIIDGVIMNSNIAPSKRNIAIVFQEPTLWNHLSIKENIIYGMYEKNDLLLENVTKSLGINDILNMYPEKISGGQAKRVSLARALLSDKKYLLLDEPLTNVDIETKKIIIDYLVNKYINRKSIIYVTHDREEMKSIPFKTINLSNE